MGECCGLPRGYETLFGAKTARRDLKRYHKRGLDKTGAKLVGFLRERGIDGLTVLDIGGGVGAIDAELLEDGAARAVNAELSPHYEQAARELWQEAGVEDRAEYVVGDVTQDGIGPADVVVMHKVVCCYPDADALVGAAAERAGRYLVMSFPRERRLTRTGFGAINVVGRLLRWDYRSFIHPVTSILAAAESRGFRLALDERGFVWHAVGLERGSRS
jgi:2-polyprenyl-3-methyl-5-hydroxy-6-metoxy-1,4-benzoquinol methylase